MAVQIEIATRERIVDHGIKTSRLETQGVGQRRGSRDGSDEMPIPSLIAGAVGDPSPALIWTDDDMRVLHAPYAPCSMRVNLTGMTP